MPRKGHRIGNRGTPQELQHHEARYGIRLRASKLTTRLREIARADAAVATLLRQRIREPARWDAFMACQGWFFSDRPCPKCFSSRRTVYCSACLDCHVKRRPLVLGGDGNVAAWPPAQQTRDGYLDKAERSKRDPETVTFGPFHAVQHPLGRLAVSAPALNWSSEDMRRLDFNTINDIVQRHPEMLEVLRWAGWSA